LLLGETGKIVESIRGEFPASSRRNINELKVHLEKKADGFKSKIEKELAAAGEKESEGIRALLEDRARRIDQILANRERRETAARADAKGRRAKLGPTHFDTTRDAAPIQDERARRERALEKMRRGETQGRHPSRDP
jgi:hypothetical protein